MISKELDRAGLTAAMVTAMYPVAEQVGANRIVKAVAIPHPCGDPSLPAELDGQLPREIIATALKAPETPVVSTTAFAPKIAASG